MSEYAAREALSRMNMREVAIAPSYTGLVADLQSLASVSQKDGHEQFMSRRAELCAAMGFDAPVQRKPFAFAEGLAIIPVSGTLINRFNGSYGSVTGYNFIRSQVMAAMADSEVAGIVFDVNSYGGEAAGCFECSDWLYGLRGQKPMLSIVDSNAYSAAYAIPSATDRMVVTPTGGAGSIGVVAMHVNMAGMLDKWGIEVSYIFSGKHKVDGNPYEALPDSVRANIQAGVDKGREQFASLVDRNRNLKGGTAKSTEAATFRADEALSLGLIDAVMSPNEAAVAFLRELSGSKSQPSRKGSSMSKEDTGPATTDNAAAAQNEVRQAERARIAGITGCDEAKGREKLANHLALNTDLSVDAAKSILAAASVEKVEQPAPAAAPKAGVNPFQQVMDASKHPNVGADAGGADQGDGMTAAQRILADHAAMTGTKYDKAKA
ncbi:MAG: Burkholderia phage BcepNazgul [Pseudomonadota bacterium]|jgi:signal peptide peptidase SppA